MKIVMKKIILSLLFILVVSTMSHADNPLVTNVRTADPNPLVYNDRFYIVCGQDEVNTSAFNMYAWRLLSSTNLRDWTDHGQILRPDQVSWMPDNRAWASCIVYRNGYFYFYASNDWQIGVLRSTSITGPYEDVNGRPLIDSNTPGHAARDIDPMCYIDDDGQAYLFWGGDGNCRYARLNSDMISLATSVMDVPGLTSYLEAPFVIKENNTYFLMYADSPWPSEIRYATSSSISGPWSYRGVIGTPTGSGTNHEGVAYYKGQWWYTYHTEELSNNNPYSRSVCVDKMYINGNTIERVTYTDDSGGGVDSEPTAVPTPDPTPPPQSQNPIWSGGPYTLNGSNYEEAPDNITMDLFDFTVASWVKLNSVDTWSRIFDFGRDTTYNMFLTPSCDSGYIRFAITITGNSDEQRINGSNPLSSGSWQHVAVVKSGTTGILYVNGNEAGRNSTMTLRPVDLGETPNTYIGRSQYTDDPYLNGEVDDFYLYNRPLSSSEVASLADTPPGSEILGDVNNDGSIDIVDALLVAQCYVGITPCPPLPAGDVNCNGSIDIVDALLIAQYYVGIINSFC